MPSSVGLGTCLEKLGVAHRGFKVKIALDSTVYCQDYHLGSPNFRILLEGLPLLPATLVVPEVVIDEVVNRFRKVLGRELPSAVKINVQEETSSYRVRLVEALKRAGAEILPYPEVDHKTVVEQDLLRRKPFKRDGRGYRDFLIWSTLKRLLFVGTERLHFVSGNTSDFGEPPTIDPQLQEGLINPHRIKLHRSLRQFNDEIIIPRLTMLGEIKETLAENGLTGFDPLGWIKANLLNMIHDHELGPILVGLPDGAGRVWPRQLVSLESLRAADVRSLDSGKILIQLELKVELEISVDLDWDDYVRYSEVREFCGASESFEFQWSYHTEDVEVTVDLIFDPATTSVESEDIRRIKGSYGWVDLSDW